MATPAVFIIVDTSVLLSFICSNNENFLLAFVQGAPLYVPETIDNEMARKLKERRFKHGRKTWETLKDSQYITVLKDDYSTLLPIIRGYAGPKFGVQDGLAKNLGEYVGLAHCISRQRINEEKKIEEKVAILLDDGDGVELARKRKIMSFSSEQVLLRAVQLRLLPSRGEAKKVWDQLRKYDEHVPFEDTKLSDRTLY
ncbi:PIN domain-containing protein [Arcanobacterium phocae]|uniref:hypothetical protein n=1 Tax=Arcanobacterium phocae TaxID=131112 RepID=UPI001C0F356E|nr:hypothetical protein [Arcanobacterium phocae]